ncbi:hypothetical protein LCGC14_0249980 [marine sediment metagenome]|uniref:Uncharacterized protein n=1 Tax=marine sediment metagenome TaxID=412755 RepID=A0A0F9U5C6_9ZZZZ
MKRELKVWNGKEAESKEEPLVFWLDQEGSTVRLRVAVESEGGEDNQFFIGEIQEDGVLYLYPSIPEQFSLQLDDNGRIVVKNA